MPAFGPLSTEFHDAEQPSAGNAEIAWYDLRLPRGAGRVLEAMCGSGRVLVPLAQRGHSLHGVDASATMVALCESRVASANLPATLFRQNVAALNLPFRYAAAYVSGSSFPLIADERVARKALERIRAHLVPPGRLLLDLSIPDIALHPPAAPLVEVRTTTLADGARITLRSETIVNAASRRIDSTLRFEKRAGARAVVREDEQVSRTWYDEKRIGALLLQAGYVDVDFVEPAQARIDGRGFGVIARAP